MAHSLALLSSIFLALLKVSASSDDLVRTSCVHASYPEICVLTLSAYPDPPRTPRELAQAAVKVSITRARRLGDFLADETENASRNKREKAALKDCLEQMGDSVEELQRTLSELGRLRQDRSGFRFRMSNAETWVSAALSDDETCLDGMKEAAGRNGKVKEEVRKRVVEVGKVTSNALYLINQLDSKRP